MVPNIEDLLRGYFKSKKKIQFAVLFGSYSKKKAHSKSDVDLAVAARQKLSLREKIKLNTELSILLHKEVDLIDLQEVSGPILQESLCSSKILINRDRDLYARLLRKLWYYNADMLPHYQRILETRQKKFLSSGRKERFHD